eukprot:scaffold1790_cov257-Pinguiococcus_pyrenoidosus.AAC.22
MDDVNDRPQDLHRSPQRQAIWKGQCSDAAQNQGLRHGRRPKEEELLQQVRVLPLGTLRSFRRRVHESRLCRARLPLFGLVASSHYD